MMDGGWGGGGGGGRGSGGIGGSIMKGGRWDKEVGKD